MKKKVVTLHSAKIRITKLKRLLWESYVFLKDSYGMEGDDFISGREEYLTSPSDRGTELKRKIRKVFENK